MKAEMANKEDDRYHFVCLFFIFFLMFVNDLCISSLFIMFGCSIELLHLAGGEAALGFSFRLEERAGKNGKRLLLYPCNLFHFTFSRGLFFVSS